jgi:hypothetical protein
MPRFKINDNVEIDWEHMEYDGLRTPFGTLTKGDEISMVVEELLEVQPGFNDIKVGVYSKETLQKLGVLYFQERLKQLKFA